MARSVCRQSARAPFKPVLLALAIAALCPAQPAHAQTGGTQQQARFDFRIPAGTLAGTLTRIGQQSGQQILFDPDAVGGRQAPELSGNLSVREALERVLAGSGLLITPAGNGFVVRKPAGGASQTMREVSVTARVERAATTEGSGSYTTAETSTATKLPLSLRETPQSATVITRQRMDDQAMTSIMDVVQAAPGLYLAGSDGPGRPAIRARGFYADVMYEGFSSEFSSYIPSSQANMALYDRVEIVRGAAGLAQGRGNPSAAINLIHKRPTREFQGSVTLSAGSWDDYGAMVDLGGPLNEAGSLRGRVVAARQDAKTFRDVERHDHDLFYGVIEADLGPDTLLTLGAHRQKDFTNNWWGGLPISVTGQHLGLSRSTFPGNDWEHSDSAVDTIFSVLEHRLAGDWQLRLSTLHSDRDLDLLGTYLYRETDTTFRHSVWGGAYNYKSANYEASASGTYKLLGRRHELAFGAISQSLTTKTYNRSWQPSPFNTGVDITTWDPRSTTRPTATRTGTSENVNRQDSFYATTRLHLSDPLKLLLGLRADWYEYDNRTGTGSYKVNRNLTHYAGLTYDLDQRHTAYASYTDIFTPQSAKDVSGKVIEPIVGKNYEVGLKGEYFDGALNASVALFQIDQTNRARVLDDQSTCPTFPASSCYEASGLVRSKGIDLEIQGALTPNWQVGAGLTWSHAKYVRDADATLIGKTFYTAAPRQQFKLSTLYRLQGAWQGWRVGGSLYQQSRFYSEGTTNGVNWRNQQGSYTVTDLLIGWQPMKDLDLQLNVTNLFDRTYYRAVAYSTLWGPQDIYGEPRKFKLTAKYSF
ncbi:TonB-dependent siderophore receptor [Pseudothauera nasutitermitis]|nr:TonB-dependent siderophore receptor [Pseudothauera nasutitermitis]